MLHATMAVMFSVFYIEDGICSVLFGLRIQKINKILLLGGLASPVRTGRFFFYIKLKVDMLFITR